MLPIALAVGWWWGDHATASGAVRDPDTAEQQARAYLAAHLPAGTELRLVEDRLDGSLRTVTFQQTWHGVPIVGAEAGVVFARDRVLAARERVIALPAMTALRGSGNVILPIGGRLELADAIDDGDATIFTASDGKVLARTTRRRDAIGALAFDVPLRWPGNGRVQLPAPGAQIAIDGVAGQTAADGTFAWTGDAPAPLAVTPTGVVQLIPQQGTLATATLTATPDATSVWSLATDPLGDAQLAAYVYATIALANDVRIEPSYADYVATGIPVFVDEIVPCTAYSSGQSVHFAQAGQGCENTGRLQDVVSHELGHVFHFNTYIRGMGAFDTELSEGLADYNAIDLTGDSGVGRGFFGDATPVRDVSLLRRWPDDLAADPHATGRILGGALWDLRVAAGAAVAENVFHGLVLRAPNIAEVYGAALIEDDDDGDLSNGTPHQCAIDRAFSVHGLQPAYATIDAAGPTSDGHAITVAVARNGTVDPACPPIEIASIAVAWEAAGQSGTLALVASGDTWSAPLPAVPDGALVRYTLAITRADGTTSVRPDNPADPQYVALAGDATTLWCASMDTDPGFTLHGFSYGPLGTAPDPSENPHAAFTGTNVVGNTRASFYGADVRATADAPPIDVRGHSSVHLQFRRWLTVQDFAFDQATVEVNGAIAWHNADTARGDDDHIDREWRFVDLDVSDAAASGTLDVRWTLASNDDGVAYGGWNLDDVCVVAVDAPSEVRAGGGCSGGGGGGVMVGVLVLLLCRRRQPRDRAPC